MKTNSFKGFVILFSSILVFFLISNYAFPANANSKSKSLNTNIKNPKKISRGFYIPAGTRIKGVLLNGADVAIGENNNNSLLINLVSHGVFPIGYSTNLKYCFVIAKAYSSSSCDSCLHIRTIRLSCIVNNGTDHAEGPIYGYVKGKSKLHILKGKIILKHVISINGGRKVTIVITKKSYIPIKPNKK
ncbi:MAG: TraB/TrbI/VirB10 family type IV secretion system protein [bacterium]